MAGRASHRRGKALHGPVSAQKPGHSRSGNYDGPALSLLLRSSMRENVPTESQLCGRHLSPDTRATPGRPGTSVCTEASHMLLSVQLAHRP